MHTCSDDAYVQRMIPIVIVTTDTYFVMVYLQNITIIHQKGSREKQNIRQ